MSDENDKPKKQGIPLWSFLALVGGVGLCVGGYLYFRKMKAPLLLAPAPALPLVGRDVFTLPAAACACGRDLDIQPAAPRLGAKYVLSDI